MRAEESAESASAPPSESLFGSDFQTGFARGFDAVVLRPLRFSALVAGAAVFVPAAIVTSPGGRPAIRAAYEVFVETPAKGVFRRKLGDF